jgi:hypothetical protein
VCVWCECVCVVCVCVLGKGRFAKVVEALIRIG